MTINIPCPDCGAQVRCEPADNGKRVRCPQCRQPFTAKWPAPVTPLAEIPVLDRADAMAETLPVDPPLMEALPVDPPASARARPRRAGSESPVDVLWWRGTSTDGLNTQPGVVVLRPKFVAFLPSGESKNLVAGMAGGLAKAVVGIHTISLDWLLRRRDPLTMVQDLRDDRPEDFDPCLVEIAEHLGGWVWPRKNTTVARSGKSSRSVAVIFVNGSTELRGNAPPGPVLDGLLTGWAESAMPVKGDVIGILVVSLLPLMMAAASFVGYLVSDSIPYWASFIWLGVAGLLYVLVGVKVALVRRRGKRRPEADTASPK